MEQEERENLGFSTKADLIYAHLRKQILSGDLEPGDRIVLSQIAQQMSASEIPVREAIRRLEADHLVNNIPHAGARVASISDNDFVELYQIRAWLEGMASYMAAQKRDLDHLSRLKHILDLSEKALKTDDREAFGIYDHDFHMLIATIAGNERLYSMLADIGNETQIAGRIFRISSHNNDVFYTYHSQIYHAILTQDADLAERRAREHRMDVMERLIKKNIG